jgi:hypothetical protein
MRTPYCLVFFLSLQLLACKKPSTEKTTPSSTQQAMMTFMDRNHDTYEAYTAVEKASFIEENIRYSAYADQLPDLDDGLLSNLKVLWDIMTVSFVKKAFTNDGDFFEKGRTKAFHRYGSTVFLKFVTDPQHRHPYTGLFASGDPYCIGRFSFAVAPTADNTIPGMALKFFIDHGPSLNIMAMNSLDGQTSHNLFEKTFTNMVSDPTTFILKRAVPVFAQALLDIHDENTDPNRLTTDHLARMQEDGTPVHQDKAPYRLIFEPTTEAQHIMTNPSIATDFRKNLQGKGKGVTLYKVYGTDKTATGETDKVWIGDLIATSNFAASEFADKGLFFKHFMQTAN